MTRVWLAAVAVVAATWAGAIGVQALGDPLGRPARLALGLAALATAGGHLLVALAVGSRLGDRSLEVGPGWVAVQAERHRRMATRFATWGLAASALAGVAAWGFSGVWTPPGWALWFASGLNLGVQPGLLLAEGWAIMARSRLDRLARTPA